MSGACSEIVADIEDLISSQDITPKERYSTKKNRDVRIRAKKSNPQPQRVAEQQLIDSEDQSNKQSSLIPGTQKIYVKTWGCAHNSSDSEYMAGQLASYGYTLVGKFHHFVFQLLRSALKTEW